MAAVIWYAASLIVITAVVVYRLGHAAGRARHLRAVWKITHDRQHDSGFGWCWAYGCDLAKQSHR